MANLIDTLLLFSLPASGKSEMRRYMAHLSPEQCREDFGIGQTLQLDDYPYVHFMHRIDDELLAAGWKNLYYKGANRPFVDDWTWAVLIELLNEDYANLVSGKQVKPVSAAQDLFDRLDAAHAKLSLPQPMGEVPWRIRTKVGLALEKEVREHYDALNTQASQDKKGKTIVIEAARGAANGSAFPLSPPYGYDTAFQYLSPTILEKSAVLYIWVDPKESRRKNIERGRPDGQGSILHHSVPMEVMLGQYGCDDMDYLISQSDKPGSIRVERLLQEGNKYVTKVYHLPVGRFDNRQDKTTFVREPKEKWAAADVKQIHDGLRAAFSQMKR
jgi:hypothetical protein